MRIIVSVLLASALALSSSMASAEEMMYPIIPLNAVVRESLKTDDTWKACGNYFAAAETTGGKIVHFNYEMWLPESARVFAFYMIDEIITSIDDKQPIPFFVTGGREIRIWMNGQDFRASLPCLARGSNI